MDPIRRFRCNVDGCGKRFKRNGHLKQHKAVAHDIGVVWHRCEVDGCGKRFKRRGTLYDHLKRSHHPLYVARMKKEEELVNQQALEAGWVPWNSGDTLPPPGHFKREHHIDLECAEASPDRKYARIDFVFGFERGYVFLEVDERQHRFGCCDGDGAHLSCDGKRMANVHTSLVIEFASVGQSVPNIYWLRYNPHAWKVDGETRRGLNRIERASKVFEYLQTFVHAPGMGIGYAFMTRGARLDWRSSMPPSSQSRFVTL